MPHFQAEVPTSQGSRYLQQLCKHWSHRFEVAFDPQHGVVHMKGADCTFDAGPDALRLDLSGEAAERLRGVVAEHLQRFAFREELAIDWAAVPAEARTE